jgi:hypothetical protein
MPTVKLTPRPESARVAVQWTGDNAAEVKTFQQEYMPSCTFVDNNDGTATIAGLWPASLLNTGDWLTNFGEILSNDLKQQQYQELAGTGPYSYTVVVD